MAGNAHENHISNGGVEKPPLSPFESAAKPSEKMSFPAIMADEVQKGQCALLNSKPMEMSPGKAGNEHLDLGKWNPAMECSTPLDGKQAADSRLTAAIDGTAPAPLKAFDTSFANSEPLQFNPASNRTLDFDAAPKLLSA